MISSIFSLNKQSAPNVLKICKGKIVYVTFVSCWLIYTSQVSLQYLGSYGHAPYRASVTYLDIVELVTPVSILNITLRLFWHVGFLSLTGRIINERRPIPSIEPLTIGLKFYLLSPRYFYFKNSANFVFKSQYVISERKKLFSFGKSQTCITPFVLLIIIKKTTIDILIKRYLLIFLFQNFYFYSKKEYVVTLNIHQKPKFTKIRQIDIHMIGKISLVILLHCVYSLLRYRKYLLASQEPLEHLPTDIIVEILFGVVLGLVSILSYTDKFKNLREFVPVKTYDASFTGKNLANFNSLRSEMFLQILKQKYKTQTFLLNEA